jgi:circadian clock protein KaiC
MAAWPWGRHLRVPEPLVGRGTGGKSAVTPVDPVERLLTGIPGLDAVLRGGLVKGSVYVVQGPPGAGKTILANQLGYRHAAAGGRVVYMTLMAETHARMMQSLRGMAFFRPELVPSAFQYVSGYKILIDEGEQGLSRALYTEMKAKQASLLVLDGLFAVEEVCGSRGAYRAFVHGLQAYAGATGCTMLLLTNVGPGRESNPEHTLVDGSIELTRHTGDMRTVRTLQVHKTRGSDQLLGLHHLAIGGEGITVYPRLEALLAEPTTLDGAPTGRLRTGVAGLDAMLGGGLPAASTTIVLGPSGAGKTMLALGFLADATPEAPAVMLGLFEPPRRLRDKARRIGIDLEGLERSGAVELLWRPPLGRDPDGLALELIDRARQRGAARVVIDTLGGIEQAAYFPGRLPAFFMALANELRGAEVTALYTSETPDLLGTSDLVRLPPYAGAMDNILLMRFAERGGRLRRLLSVLKVRDSEFDHTVREYAIGAGGIRVQAEPAD